MLPYPSKIRPLSDVYFPWVANDVGEVYGEARTLNHKKTPPFVAGQHICGTRKDFEIGGVRDDVAPAVVYDQNQIPVCCQPAFVGEGGAAASGTADISVVPGVIRYRFQATNGIDTIDIVLDPITIGMQHFWRGFDSTYSAQLYKPGDLDPIDWGAVLVRLDLTGFTRWNRAPSWDGFGTTVFTWLLQTMPGPMWSDLTVTRL